MLTPSGHLPALQRKITDGRAPIFFVIIVKQNCKKNESNLKRKGKIFQAFTGICLYNLIRGDLIWSCYLYVISMAIKVQLTGFKQ